MIRIEHFPADIFGLTAPVRAALSGRLAASGVARALVEVERPRDPFVPAERAHLAKWLESQITTQGPPVAVLDSIRTLAQPGVSCVVTSARPALLLGPLSNLWRALQVVKLARELTRAWGTRVIPVLWNHADEHDATGLETACVLNRNYDLQEVGLEPVSRGRRPLFDLPLTGKSHGLGALRAVLQQLYGDLPHVERALEIFVPREGESLPASFTRALLELLGSLGLVVIEPQVMGEEIAHSLGKLVASNVHEELCGALQSLPAQVFQSTKSLGGEPLVYAADARGRRALSRGGDGYRYADEPGSRTASELAAEIVQEPRSWSAGEPLRPLVRDLVLPVAANVGDERELLRHLWLRQVRERLDLPLTGFAHRLRATLLDDGARESLERLQLTLGSALGTWPSVASQRKVDQAGELVQELRGIAARARRELADRKARLLELDATLASSVKSTSRELEEVLHRLWEKVGRVQANRTGRRARHGRRVENGLRPRGQPQDEVLGPFAWVARYGTGWLEEVVTEIEPFAGEHLALHLSD